MLVHDVMPEHLIKRTGSRLALLSCMVGLFIAYVIMMWLHGINSSFLQSADWLLIDEYRFNMLTGAFSLIAAGYFLGQKAALEILIKKRNSILVGVMCGLLILWIGTFAGSSVGFFREGFYEGESFGDAFFDYYVKPFYWVTAFGMIPVLLIGAGFGLMIKRAGNQK